MDRINDLLLLSLVSALVLSMITCSVHSIKVFGKHTSDDPMRKLDNIKAEKIRLEREIENCKPGEVKNHLEMNLKRVNYWIREIEETSQVLFKDYLQMVAEQTAELEKEKAERQKHQERGKELAEVKDQLTREYAEYVDTQDQYNKNLIEEKNQITRERDEVMQELKGAQNLLSQALEAITVTIQEGYEIGSIPHQKDIIILRNITATSEGIVDENQRMDYLLKTQTELLNLLKTLHEESKLSTELDFKNLEVELAKMEIDFMKTRDEHDNVRQEIQQTTKKAGDYTRENLSLQQANERVIKTHKRLQQIARKSAYIKAISEVHFLMGECAKAIKYANEATRRSRGLGFFWTKGIGPQRMVRMDSASKQGMGLQLLPSLLRTENPSVGKRKIYEEAISMHGIVHQKALLYKDLLELYRTKLSTEIINGLATVNVRLPVPLPGCSINRLVELRDMMNKWAERVQYGTHLTKELHTYDNMIFRYFPRFLQNLRNVFVTFVGKSAGQITRFEDNDEFRSSVEKFDENTHDYNNHHQYVTLHLTYLLDMNADLSSEQLREFRYNFIFGSKVPDVLEGMSQKILKELTGSQIGDNKPLGELGHTLKEMENAIKTLTHLFSVLISRVKSTIEEQNRAYQTALEKHQKCRQDLVKSLPFFRNMNK